MVCRPICREPVDESVIMERMSAAPEPHLRGGRRGASRAALVLHGGREHDSSPVEFRHTPYLRMLDFYLSLRWHAHGTAVYVLRYRVRGWNAERSVPDPVVDARWALNRIGADLPGVPIALLGHSMGGRTAFAVADDPRVVGVCALAPWLPQGEPLPSATSRTRFVIAHGDADPMTSAAMSLAYAERLRAQGNSVARFELPNGKHALLDRSNVWRRFATRTTLGLVGDGSVPDPVIRQFSGIDADLRTDLTSAFG